jgi:hypothetical protein
MRNDMDGLPAGPRLPRAAQTVLWFRNAQWMLDTCQARFGDMFTLKIANEGTWVMTSNTDAIKQVFTGDPRLLHAGEGNRVLLPVLGPSSVLLLDDRPHLSQRKLMLPAFHGERMQRYGELMASVAGEEIESWPLGEPYKLRPRMQALTLEIILRAVFGVVASSPEGEGPRVQRLREQLRHLLDILTDPLHGVALMVLGPVRTQRLAAFRRELERVNAPIYEEIAARRGASDLAERDDIMSLLLQATHEDGSPMSDEELRDELVTLLVAGHETTANALAWAAERLCRHPDKLAHMRFQWVFQVNKSQWGGLPSAHRAVDDHRMLFTKERKPGRPIPNVRVTLNDLQHYLPEEPVGLDGLLEAQEASLEPAKWICPAVFQDAVVPAPEHARLVRQHKPDHCHQLVDLGVAQARMQRPLVQGHTMRSKLLHVFCPHSRVENRGGIAHGLGPIVAQVERGYA